MCIPELTVRLQNPQVPYTPGSIPTLGMDQVRAYSLGPTYKHALLVSPREYQLESRGAPDPEFCYPAGSGSMPDPDHLDPAGSEPDPDYLDPAGSGSGRIRTGPGSCLIAYLLPLPYLFIFKLPIVITILGSVFVYSNLTVLN